MGDQDEVSAWLGVPVSGIAVDGFFFLSGMLVSASLLHRTVGDFVLARLARLWHGFAVAVAVNCGARIALFASKREKAAASDTTFLEQVGPSELFTPRAELASRLQELHAVELDANRIETHALVGNGDPRRHCHVA